MDNSHDQLILVTQSENNNMPYNQDIIKDEISRYGELSQEDEENFNDECEEESCEGGNIPNELNGFTSESIESERNILYDPSTNKINKLDDNPKPIEKEEKEKSEIIDGLIPKITYEEKKADEKKEKKKFEIDGLKSHFSIEDTKKISKLSNATPEKNENEENKDKAYIFEKIPEDKNDITQEYTSKPIFEASNSVKQKSEGGRKNNVDNMFKKVRQELSHRFSKIFQYKLKKMISFKNFNQNTKKIDNKKYLNMKLKELFKHIYIEDIKKNAKNNKYYLTEEDEKFLAYIDNDFNDEKLKPILNMKMEDIYIEFFTSQEYRNLIKKLRDKGNTYYYIYTFIEKNKEFVKYYKDAKDRKKNSK